MCQNSVLHKSRPRLRFPQGSSFPERTSICSAGSLAIFRACLKSGPPSTILLAFQPVCLRNPPKAGLPAASFRSSLKLKLLNFRRVPYTESHPTQEIALKQAFEAKRRLHPRAPPPKPPTSRARARPPIVADVRRPGRAAAERLLRGAAPPDGQRTRGGSRRGGVLFGGRGVQKCHGSLT